MAKGIKTGGRTKGTPNKTTARLRELLTESAEQYMASDMMADLKGATPAERLHHLREVLKLIVPKPIDGDLISENEKEPLVIVVKSMDGND